MSDDALKWASDQVCPSGRAKNVLVLFARHADEEGVAWMAVPTIAEDQQMSDRQAQRLIRDLVAAGLMSPTGAFKYRNIPYYQLALEREGALAAVRAARKLAVAEARRAGRKTPVERRANGDMDVTVQVSPLAPNGDISDANGDTGVTQRRIDEEEEERERGARALEDAGSPGFEGLPGDAARRETADRLEAAYVALAAVWFAALPGRVDDAKARLALAAADATGEDVVLIGACAARFLADAKASRDRPMLHNWLAGKRWRGFEPKAGDDGRGGAGGPARFDGPDELMALLRANRQRDWRAYLLGQRWDGEARAIVVSTETAAAQLKAAFAADFAALGVSVVVRRAA